MQESQLLKASKLGWKLRREAVPDDLGRVIFHLRWPVGAMDELKADLLEISNPRNVRYGDYKTIHQIGEMINVPSSSIKHVRTWLMNAGIPENDIQVTKSRDAIIVETKASLFEPLFETKFHIFESTDDKGRILLRTLGSGKIPETISNHISIVQGINDFTPRSDRRNLQTTSVPISSQRLNATPGGASLVTVRGNPSALKLTYIPVCLNGQLPTDAVNPCQAEGDAISSAYMSISSSPSMPNFYSNEANLLNVTCSMSGNVTCISQITSTDYIPITEVVLRLNYASSAVGPDNVFDEFPVVSAPYVTPLTIKKQYSIPSNLRVNDSRVTQSVAEFEQQYYTPSDLTNFFNAMGLRDGTNVTVIGPNDWQGPLGPEGVEANLDIQYIMGMAPGAPTTFWSIAANSTTEIDDILEWAIQVQNSDNPPLVNSLSYGMAEDNVDEYLGAGYMAQTETELMKLALMGITIIIADGDTGAGELGDPPMSIPNCDTLHGDWPSNSPYVLAAGSTYFTPLSEPLCYYATAAGGIDCMDQPMSEVIVGMDQGMRWTTGGGFSNFTSRPSYQDWAVNQYLEMTNNLSDIPSDVFNVNGRAYPDMATIGHNLWVSNNGTFISVDGTSASAPILGGILSLLNQARLQAGQPVLGWFNPLLYQILQERPGAFNDVVHGSNKCGAYGTVPQCCDWGFDAVPGYDVTSGVGSPNFPELLDAVLYYGDMSSTTGNGDDDDDDDEVPAWGIALITLSCLIVAGLAFVGFKLMQPRKARDEAGEPFLSSK